MSSTVQTTRFVTTFVQSEAQKAQKEYRVMAGGELSGAADPEEASGVFGVDSAVRHGAFISEAWFALRNGARRYCAVIKPKRGKPWCGVAEKSFLEHGLDIDVLARYGSSAKAPEGAVRKALQMAELYCSGIGPEMPVPAEEFLKRLKSQD